MGPQDLKNRQTKNGTYQGPALRRTGKIGKLLCLDTERKLQGGNIHSVHYLQKKGAAVSNLPVWLACCQGNGRGRVSRGDDGKLAKAV